MIEELESRTLLSATSGSTHHVHGWRHDPTAVERARRVAPTSSGLSVSPNHRYLVNSDGTPFFYMADTAWHLFNKTTRGQADQYLETRAAQGFTVIQAEINAHFRDVYRHWAFTNNDVTRPNEAFFQNMDYMIRRANSLGMYVALVPLDSEWSANGIFNKNNVYQFGRYLGRRYANDKIIWVLGGDVSGNVGDGVAMWRELAAGITRGAANKDESKVLMTFHPTYAQSSSQWFQNDSWLDFNAIQSGHSFNRANYDMVSADYGKNPQKPVIDIEGAYEDIPAGIRKGNPRLTDYDVRKAAYASVFAGSFGVTFGNNNVWQFVTSPGSKRNLASTKWQDALVTMGAYSMKYIKRLMMSRPMLNRVPDQSLVAGTTYGAADRIQATRAGDGSYAFVYTASGKSVTVNLNRLSGTRVTARWYNPRAGKSVYLGVYAKSGARTFKAPSSGVNNDWVLVLDDTAKGYRKP
jgi:hypothetical protein